MCRRSLPSLRPGSRFHLLQGWLAAVGFTLQIYFDFSAYSDMACGSALFFGVRLPLNFDSPLKASNIIDFWLRWHITLTRFLTAYVYNPIALALTRRRAANRLPMLKAHGSTMYAFFSVLAWPTLATMLLSGVWHGAGYTFLLWGLLHGLYLIVNHAWRQYGPRSVPQHITCDSCGICADICGCGFCYGAISRAERRDRHQCHEGYGRPSWDNPAN